MSEVFAQAGAVFTGASTLFTTLKEGANAIHEAKNLELYERMLSVYGDVMELVEKNRQLSDENRTLQEQLTVSKTMHHRPPFFYQENDPTPFCPACWENHKKAIHVVFADDAERYTSWGCPACKQFYYVKKAGAYLQFSGQNGHSHGPNSWMR